MANLKTSKAVNKINKAEIMIKIFLIFIKSPDKIIKTDAKRRSVGSFKFDKDICDLPSGKKNPDKEIVHSVINIKTNAPSQTNTGLSFLFFRSAVKFSNPNPARTAKQKENKTIILEAALVDSTGIFKVIKRSSIGV